MRIAVVGGTGLVGRHVVSAVATAGHTPVPLARSLGVDAFTGAGLDPSLVGVDVVIDVTTSSAQSAQENREFFTATTRNLLAAEVRTGVGHHVVLSIVGIERSTEQPHYAGKLAQEEEALRGPVPVSIVRATQFHEFAGQVIEWSTVDGVCLVAPALVQPVAAADVGAYLVEVGVGQPRGLGTELAGPRREDLFDLARRTAAARGLPVTVVPSWDGMLGVHMAGNVMLPGPDAHLTTTTFDDWLATLP
jgi:uncharacterized protein YbjT (DUF2867 family)